MTRETRVRFQLAIAAAMVLAGVILSVVGSCSHKVINQERAHARAA